MKSLMPKYLPDHGFIVRVARYTHASGIILLSGFHWGEGGKRDNYRIKKAEDNLWVKTAYLGTFLYVVYVVGGYSQEGVAAKALLAVLISQGLIDCWRWLLPIAW